MKTRLLLNVMSAMIIAGISCNKEDAIQPLTRSDQSNSAQGHFIGEHFGGGIIFYLDKTKKHGIIAASEDLEEAASWSRKDTLNNATSIQIGAGVFNTMHIYKKQGDPGNEADDYAAIECLELVENGYSDWYLPSKNELNEMYLHKDIIGNFMPFAYWSSTEINTTKAWLQNFSNGVQVQQLKTAGYAIRAVRYF